jgi:hypothetical protein
VHSPPARRTALTRLSRRLQVRKAVDALMAHLAKERAGKKSLFEEEDMFSLARRCRRPRALPPLTHAPPVQVVALAKVPAHGSVKAHRMCVAAPAATPPRAAASDESFCVDSPSHGLSADD